MKAYCREAMNNDEPEKKSWLQRLANRWKVRSILQVILILITFALGGSLCAFIGGKILPALQIEHRLLNGILYILLVTLLWPICVLLISIPFGQFTFFKEYLIKMGRRMSGKKQKTDVIE